LPHKSLLTLYIGEMRRIRSSGSAKGEVSYYPALEQAFNAVGGDLRPRVVCIQHPKAKENDHPDFGFFEARPHAGAPAWTSTPVPERGVVEAKPLTYNIDTLQASKQVGDYLDTFGLVLITNFREFRLLGRAAGNVEVREEVVLADSEAAFWALKASGEAEVTFEEFVNRVLLHRAPLRKSEDVAFFLASYAREAMAELETHATLPAVANLRTALEQALGISFDHGQGERLFRSTLVQTLFYGLFGAWMMRCENGETGHFDWRTAGFNQTVPVMGVLFSEAAQPHRLGKMLGSLLDRAASTLARIQGDDLTAFLAAFHERSAVAYFYEPFLQAFDPLTRSRLGVWYTPPEIVKYMVERVDRVLRTELHIADGLADENVWVLDPACGTGSFLVEVLRKISSTLTAQGKGELVGPLLHKAATSRVVGFEIMTAPLVIAHWQVGEVLRKASAQLKVDGTERASIYLTNALTGWTASENGPPPLPGFETLEHERDKAGTIKQKRPILVVLGNPPYNAFAGTSPDEEEGLVQPYKRGLQEPPWSVKKFNLDDLYVRFFRIAERRIAETGTGIVCFISPGSWVTERSFVVMRQSLTSTFDRAWIENMHGNRKISERGPDGKTSQTVFAMAGVSSGIKQGIAITLFARTGTEDAVFKYRDDINASSADARRKLLLESLKDTKFESRYEVVEASTERWFRLKPGQATEEYAEWPSVSDLSRAAPENGLMEKRGGELLNPDKADLEKKMRAYCDPSVSNQEIGEMVPGLMVDRARFKPLKTRFHFQAVEGFDPKGLKKYLLRPFETCWAYVSPARPLWNEPRPNLLHMLSDAGGFLATRPSAVADPEGWPILWTSRLGDNDALRGHAYYFPVVENLSGKAAPNVSQLAEEYLARLGINADDAGARLLWMHVLAVSYSPKWLKDNADGIRYGWPRVPLPENAAGLRVSAKLGERVAALLDPDVAVDGVTSGAIRPELVGVGQLAVTDGLPLDLSVSAQWGSLDRLGRVNPGPGRYDERSFQEAEAATAEAFQGLGLTTFDVALNRTTYWKNVPAAVWKTHIGGYQVLKKWLSYRQVGVLKRAMTASEADHFSLTARRLAALLLLGTELDENFEASRDAYVAAEHNEVDEDALSPDITASDAPLNS
jgi:hypothetical protein